MEKTVFLSIGAEFIHGGHIAIIEKAAELGELTVGVLSDEVLMRYKGYPILTYEERCKVVSHIKGVSKVIKKDSLGYEKVIEELRPDYVVHSDRWRSRTKERIQQVLKKYGGELIEFPYTEKNEYEIFDMRTSRMRHMPEARRENCGERFSFLTDHCGFWRHITGSRG